MLNCPVNHQSVLVGVDGRSTVVGNYRKIIVRCDVFSELFWTTANTMVMTIMATNIAIIANLVRADMATPNYYIDNYLDGTEI